MHSRPFAQRHNLAAKGLPARAAMVCFGMARTAERQTVSGRGVILYIVNMMNGAARPSANRTLVAVSCADQALKVPVKRRGVGLQRLTAAPSGTIRARQVDRFPLITAKDRAADAGFGAPGARGCKRFITDRTRPNSGAAAPTGALLGGQVNNPLPATGGRTIVPKAAPYPMTRHVKLFAATLTSLLNRAPVQRATFSRALLRTELAAPPCKKRRPRSEGRSTHLASGVYGVLPRPLGSARDRAIASPALCYDGRTRLERRTTHFAGAGDQSPRPKEAFIALLTPPLTGMRAKASECVWLPQEQRSACFTGMLDHSHGAVPLSYYIAIHRRKAEGVAG